MKSSKLPFAAYLIKYSVLKGVDKGSPHVCLFLPQLRNLTDALLEIWDMSKKPPEIDMTLHEPKGCGVYVNHH